MPLNSGGINITVSTKPSISVGITDSRTAATANIQPVAIKALARSINTLSDIPDVIETAPQNGYTLVYNATTDKYEVKQLTVSDINIETLDGGTF
jgi:hypothetical protein